MSELESAVHAALATVIDPEIHQPITDLGMVESVGVDSSGVAAVTVLLTIAGCPLANTIESDVTKAVSAVPGISAVNLVLGTMSDEQRSELKKRLRGGREDRDIPFAKSDSLTQVILVASGKGGVGKSSVTVNIAMALAAQGRTVGVLDADIYGHSIPQMLGLSEASPTSVDGMIMPVPSMGLRVISIGMLKQSRDQVIAWRGPILDRALQQFLADVYWGDLDVLLMDLPPGTGDIAISVAQLVPSAEILVVTTPQLASQEVAERAGSIALQTHQRIAGVVENMSYLECPHCDERIDVFGSGGGQAVASSLSQRLGADVPLLGQIPIDVRLREGGDSGQPLVLSDPTATASQTLLSISDRLSGKPRGLASMSLGLSPARRA